MGAVKALLAHGSSVLRICLAPGWEPREEGDRLGNGTGRGIFLVKEKSEQGKNVFLVSKGF